MLNLLLLYRFITLLSTPFKKWDAFELGIIDERGETIRKFKDLKTAKEKEAWSRLHILVRNIKRIIEKIPGGKRQIATYAATLFLLKESDVFSGDDEVMLTEDVNIADMEAYINEVTMSVGSAGLGDGKVVVSKKAHKEYLDRIKKEKKNDKRKKDS